jgi:hypothetical protein
MTWHMKPTKVNSESCQGNLETCKLCNRLPSSRTSTIVLNVIGLTFEVTMCFMGIGTLQLGFKGMRMSLSKMKGTLETFIFDQCTDITLLSFLVAVNGTKYRVSVILLEFWDYPYMWKRKVCIVEFSTSNYKLSKFLQLHPLSLESDHHHLVV